MTNMRAAVFHGNGILKLETVERPKVKNDSDVIIKVIAASICGSDIHALHVPPGQYIKPDIIFGHEFFGEIVEKGEAVDNFEIGDKVAVNPCIPCNKCYECKRGFKNICSNPYHYGQTADGGFAQYALVHQQQLYILPHDINPDVAAQIEPLACIMHAIKMINPFATDRVLLYGAGPIGLTFIKVLNILGIKDFIVVAKGEDRIKQASECGAPTVLNSQTTDVKEEVFKIWEHGADVIIDAVGTGEILSELTQIIGSRGRIMLFGLNHNAKAQVSPAMFTQKEVTLMGALGKSFDLAIELLKNDNLNLDEFVTHRVKLEDLNQAFELLMNKKASRVIVYPNDVTQ